ncbi:MAG: L-aspartate oxidase [Actinomycetota bacterium]
MDDSLVAPAWVSLGDLPVNSVDVLVVGSGIAGMSAALACRGYGRVLVITKNDLSNSATRYAQGGIAAAMGLSDSPQRHLADTIEGGAGLCDPEAARILVEEGPARVRELIELGTRFDHEGSELALGIEGGHSRPRVIHAGGDATGAEVSRALIEAVRHSGVEVWENAFLADFLRDSGGRCAGALVLMRDRVRAVLAGAVILATGGFGQLYQCTTNPDVATGDGVAAALRAGARVADLEFVQFHPTALHVPVSPRPLISEAMRGEGAVLRDASGSRVMEGVHPREDLAPRSVVTRAMAERMAETGSEMVYLDATVIAPATLERRFPTILSYCRRVGIDPIRDWIPVSPAAHYASGGVRTDLWGASSLPGLFACGEVACTGVHGANRLASNSLLEGLVFAGRIAHSLGEHLAGPPTAGTVLRPAPHASPDGLEPKDVRLRVQEAMQEGAFILRCAAGLERAHRQIEAIGPCRPDADPVAALEADGLRLVGLALVTAAVAREESRGCHWREDFPSTREAFRKRIVVSLGPDGLSLSGEPITSIPVEQEGIAG